ncbi:tRNA-modifying protein YgfZ, partial [Chromobacterium piscinae]
FVPQMANMELIGAVNFKKGCYPGQEIVARSQYLGKMKRRM